MEQSLTHIIREFEQEQQYLGRTTKEQLGQVQQETGHLRNQLDRKSKEMHYIKVNTSSQFIFLNKRLKH